MFDDQSALVDSPHREISAEQIDRQASPTAGPICWGLVVFNDALLVDATKVTQDVTSRKENIKVPGLNKMGS